MRTLTFGFLMDPLVNVRVRHDTTFALMLECQRRGHEVRVFVQGDLFYDRRTAARMQTVRLWPKQGEHFEVLTSQPAPLTELDVLFLRKDPPVDPSYLHATQLVELEQGSRPLCINRPRALRDANEKLFALHFPDLIPATLVSQDMALLREFVCRLDGPAILKPLDGFGGSSVFRTHAADANLNALIEVTTQWGRNAIVAQAYLPDSRKGDKRILLLDGEPLGAILRVPREDELRCNMAAGGTAQKTELTARERSICRALAPRLREWGLYFVGIDVIGEQLIEINVTSPTGIAELDALEGISAEARVIDFAESLAPARPS